MTIVFAYPKGTLDEDHHALIVYDWDGSLDAWGKDGLQADSLGHLYLNGGTYTRLPELAMLQALHLFGRYSTKVTLPKYPYLELLALQHPVLTNGVLVANYKEYLAAWSPAKGANSRRLLDPSCPDLCLG